MNEILNKLKAKITGHRDTYNRNETAVRRQLIEPILDELGWHTDDPSLVELNATTEDRDIPDYSLLKDKRVETYVEAKNLSTNIIVHLPQLARYCINNGKEFGIITNGNDWLLIKTFEKDTKPKDRIIWQVSIENDNVSTIKNRLSNISREQIGSLPELIEKEKQIQNFWSEYVSDENKLVDKLSIEIAKEFLAKHPDEDYEQETIIYFFKSKLWAFLTERTVTDNIEPDTNSSFKNQNSDRTNYSFTKLKKSGTPSVSDWVKQIPELRKIYGLNSWRDICDHLHIPVEGDSARRRLKKWVEQNKPNWVTVPEPKK
ncbi:MAG: type I restriction enzyme HsdR N-terminal domain-containing protein [Chitinophagales bacterium]|nr:type I restriction enzyme HsdR N-terminal domain-containing protein [Chitinophagales bacterium]MCZ2394100.1 type I restriction enzyme HsdR N-terminal domain-containing protein [Chitinophagales bacterium]